MLFGNDRNALRKLYFDAWQNHKSQKALEPLEQQLVHLILQHPEYHRIFDQPELYLDRDYLPEFGETNPFLHLSLHLAILEQVSTNRPVGISDIYAQLLHRLGDPNSVEHQMIDILGAALWEVQRTGKPFNESHYLDQLRKLL
jgi:hypothetical protein